MRSGGHGGEGTEHTISLQGVNVVDDFDRFCVGIRARVLGVETVDVGHQEEVVSVDHGGCDGGEGVVVAELDLGHGEGVVLIDDGDHAHLEELVERVDGIEVLGALGGRVSL